MQHTSDIALQMLLLSEPRVVTKTRTLLEDFKRGDTIQVGECVALLDTWLRWYDGNMAMTLADLDANDPHVTEPMQPDDPHGDGINF